MILALPLAGLAALIPPTAEALAHLASPHRKSLLLAQILPITTGDDPLSSP